MAIRFLNCGTLHLPFRDLAHGVTCLLVETNQGPVLIDTGLGVGDYLHPSWLMRFFTAVMRSPRDLNQTALHQLKRLGYHSTDVHHIVMTHLHIDHTGGLPDFPHANVYVYQPEYAYVVNRHTEWEYFKAHWAHTPNWSPQQLKGETWYDFDAIRLEAFDPEIWLIPLTGHTIGHVGVAIRNGKGWVLHGGDAVPFNMALDKAPDWISRLILGSYPHIPRIRELMKTHPEVQVVGAHMALGFYENSDTGDA
jgi:glyoxylase-like metal-dependent hydrolase (beta-lactamase superfamily II)